MNWKSRIVAMRTIGGAAAYVLALLMVANLVFLAGLEGAGASGLGPARTGTFGDLQLPAIAAVDAGQIAQALIEAGGGSGFLDRSSRLHPALALRASAFTQSGKTGRKHLHESDQAGKTLRQWAGRRSRCLSACSKTASARAATAR